MNDLLSMLRRHKSSLFQDNDSFVRQAAVALSAPFSLSLSLLNDITLCAIGELDRTKISTPISSVKGSCKLKLILRGKLSSSDSLESCAKAITEWHTHVLHELNFELE